MWLIFYLVLIKTQRERKRCLRVWVWREYFICSLCVLSLGRESVRLWSPSCWRMTVCVSGSGCARKLTAPVSFHCQKEERVHSDCVSAALTPSCVSPAFCRQIFSRKQINQGNIIQRREMAWRVSLTCVSRHVFPRCSTTFSAKQRSSSNSAL